MASSAAAQPHSTKKIVEIEHTPVELITKLEVLLADLAERNNGFAEISFEIANHRVKRFKIIESFLVSAL